MNMTHFSLKNKKYLAIAIIIYIILWQILAHIIDNNILFPNVKDIGKSLAKIMAGGNFIYLISTSLLRSIKALMLSIIMAVILSIGSYFSKFIYNVIHPILAFIKSVPTMAFIVLLLIWVSKDYAPIIIGIIISLPIFYDVILNSLLNIDNDILEMCQVYDISAKDKIVKIIFPLIVGEIIKVLSSTTSLTFKVVISAEVYSQPKYGIGASIQFEKINLNTSGIIAWMIIILAITYIFEITINLIDKNIKERFI